MSNEAASALPVSEDWKYYQRLLYLSAKIGNTIIVTEMLDLSYLTANFAQKMSHT
jgi:hypothetical protein